MNQDAFLALVRAGLWEKDIRLSIYGEIDYQIIYKLAEEQSVVGLVAAGLEHIQDVKVPKEDALQFVGRALQIEQRNIEMNSFISALVEKMRKAGIYTILIKGQGIAQCYEKPFWRSCGDVDLLLSEDNYSKAQVFLNALAESVEKESGKHQGMTIGSWIVEIHGDQHCGLSARMDKRIDDVQREIFYGGNVRSWMNGKTTVFLPSPDNDILLIFTHFLKHFYKGGLGMRQICDWCRLLWTFRFMIDKALLEERLMKMNLMSEWKAFAAYAVEYIGMPAEEIPLYEATDRWRRKAKRINAFIMSVGNMGHNREMNCRGRRSFIGRKVVSFNWRMADFLNHALIFPLDTLRFFPTIVYNGLRLATKGIG